VDDARVEHLLRLVGEQVAKIVHIVELLVALKILLAEVGK